jgi:hypothetical protein
VSPEDQGLFVLPPMVVPMNPAEAESAPGLPLASPLSEQVLKLKAKDKRFQAMSVWVEGGRVYLSGSASQWSDVHALAKAIAQLPGVENVIIGQVQIKAGK